MAKGRTLWEILTRGTSPTPSGGRATDGAFNYDPLDARDGDHVRLDILDYRDDLWRIGGLVWMVQSINGTRHPFTDYDLFSSERRCVLRLFPKDDKYTVLLLAQYWPDEPGPQPYGDEVQAILEALNDPSGEFYRYRDTDAEEHYWRIGGKVPIHAAANGIGKFTIWDFHRTTSDESGAEFTEYLYAELSGYYRGPDEIVGGDKTLIMYRGREISPEHVTVYGANK